MDNIYHFFESFCVWVDLLGYGKAFYSTNWDIGSPVALKNLERIKLLEPYTTSICNPYNETLFALNDGFIRNFDIVQCRVGWILGWFIDVICKFKTIDENDKRNGFCGVRGVVAYGGRV